jgi:hypothetical protein
MHPLSVQIITRSAASQREIQRQYIVEGRFPRWELFKILIHVFLHLKVS